MHVLIDFDAIAAAFTGGNTLIYSYEMGSSNRLFTNFPKIKRPQNMHTPDSHQPSAISYRYGLMFVVSFVHLKALVSQLRNAHRKYTHQPI